MCEIVGGVLLVVKVNESVAVPPLPSSTVIVIGVVPNFSVAGVIVTVRSLPLPPTTMLTAGMSSPFDDTAVTFNSAGGVWASSMVKPIVTAAPVFV